MKRILEPLRRLMNNLRYTQKMLLVVIVFLIPMTIASYILFSAINNHIEIKVEEKKALDLNVLLVDLLRDIQIFRGNTSTYLAGNLSFKGKIEEMQSEINTHFADVDSMTGEFTTIPEATLKWNMIKREWREIESLWPLLDSTRNYEMQTSLIENILALTWHNIGIQQIILDPDDATYQLMNMLSAQLPYMSESLGQIRAIGTMAINDGMLSVDEKTQIATLLSTVKINLNRLDHVIQSVFEVKPDIKSSLESSYRDIGASVEELSILSKKTMISGNITPSEYFLVGTEAVDSVFNFYEEINPVIGDLTDAYIEQLVIKKRIVEIAALLSFIAVVLLSIGFYLSLNGSIEKLVTATGNISGGNLGWRIEIDTKDEMAVVAAGFNDMARALEETSAEHQRMEEEILQMNLEISEKNKILEQASRMKSEFLANMSHEIRTPLTAIVGFSEMLKDGYVNSAEKQRDYAEKIFSSGEHMISLITDILDLSKIEAGKMTLNIEDVNIPELLEGSLDIVSRQAQANDIALELIMEKDLGKARVDSTRVRQMVYNLLSNGVKFTPAGGKVTLMAGFNIKGSRKYIEISVRDTGIGIPEKGVERLFIPFEQLESPLSKTYQGSGLGLAIVKRLAELHGGDIHVSSEIDNGSTFTIRLPYSIEAVTSNPISIVKSVVSGSEYTSSL